MLLHCAPRESAGHPCLSSRESDKRLNGENAINCTYSVIVMYHCTVQVNIFHRVFLNDHKVPGLDAGMTRNIMKDSNMVHNTGVLFASILN